MKHHQQPTLHRPQSRAYRSAFERLDAALEENIPSNNYEKIRLLRVAMFGDVDELQKSDPVEIPK
jgi:hypothetical protein